MSTGTRKWATKPFLNFVDGSKDLDEIIDLTKWGLLMSTALPKVCERLATPDTDQEMLNEIRQKALTAQDILDNKFSIVYSQAVITLWTLIESTILTFFAGWLANVPQSLEIDEIRKIKIPLGEYENLTNDDKYYYILDKLEDSIGSKRRPGIARFEALFDLYNISSKVHDKVKTILYELYHLRNVLVHRHGIVDRRILENCPWLKLTLDEKVVIKEESYRKYNAVAAYYILECANRLLTYEGLDKYYGNVPSIDEYLRESDSTR